MATIELHGTLDIDVTGAEEIEGKIRSTSIAALQGRIRALAYQILREQAAKDWPAGRASNGYVSTGELVNAINITGSGLSLTISMDGSRMSMVAPVHVGTVKNRNAVNHRPIQWGVHMGVRGQAFNTEMPALLEYGGGGLVPHHGSGYFERTYGMYQEQFIHILAEELRAAGFEVTEG
ncbi:hypothetical protein [Limosilactobacillus ingluviei]|uniref:Uncharacterized protein n=1 Tax=Limosilactobacillus ingluviei DSM 15946 TaxID=1423760 RepID=A0A0R1UK93_9LACO|nr:hypothetical protein [Limosilactobacillus ingluviei]KRL91699.1 hypothetical protein FC43_GL001122 [Limosilactobacillus ingluviei DSM 15946]